MAKRISAAIAALGLVLALGGAVQRSFADENQGPEKPKAGSIMDANVGTHLKAAIDDLQAQRYSDAERELGALNMDHLSPYERSRAEQLFAVADQLQGHYEAAREHLKQAIASGGLNDQEASTARFQLARLYMAVRDHGPRAGGTSFATPNPSVGFPAAVERNPMTELAMNTLALGFGASAGGSLIYLLCGGGLFGAVVIFFVLRMVGGK